MTEKQQKLVTTLELVRVEEIHATAHSLPGRPPAGRSAIAHVFVTKTVYNMPTTRILIDRLKSDQKTRRICSWERMSDTPGEWTFSRAFAEFSENKLPTRGHETFIKIKL